MTISILGWLCGLVGACVLIVGGAAAVGKLWWYACWFWGDAKAMRVSAKLGWNTGEMPEGVWLLVREHMDSAPWGSVNGLRSYNWAIMKRIGDHCHSASGGFSSPIKNITGWLEVDGKEQIND